MEFDVLFYNDEHGSTPPQSFLEDLRTMQPQLHRLLVAGLAKLRQRDYHGPPLTKQVHSEGIYELRVGSANIARMFFFFQPGRQIVVTGGYVKKSQRLDRRELERARRARQDWEMRKR